MALWRLCNASCPSFTLLTHEAAVRTLFEVYTLIVEIFFLFSSSFASLRVCLLVYSWTTLLSSCCVFAGFSSLLEVHSSHLHLFLSLSFLLIFTSHVAFPVCSMVPMKVNESFFFFNLPVFVSAFMCEEAMGFLTPLMLFHFFFYHSLMLIPVAVFKCEI